VELTEIPRGHYAKEQNAQAQRNNLLGGPQIELSNPAEKKITNREVEEPPNRVHGGRREPFAWRIRKGGLKRAPHHPADNMRIRVGEKGAAEEV
jgi:hypothetical protein